MSIAKGTFECYSTSAKLLGTWGRDGATTFRGIPEADYMQVVTNQRQVAYGPPMDSPWDDPNANQDRDTWFDKPVVGPITQGLFDLSKAIQVQVDQKVFLEGMFQDAKNAGGDEQGALMVYSYVLGRLFLVRAVNFAPAGERKRRFVFHHGLDPSGIAVMSGDLTQIIIGTVHTHYDVSGREKPEVSQDVDVPAAATPKIVVFAVDRNYLHRADPDGTAHNRLPRNLADVLSPALRIYGKIGKASTI